MTRQPTSSSRTARDILRQARRLQRLSQKDLAQRTGVTQTVLARYESGRQQPTIGAIERLVGACGYELDWSLRNIGAASAVGTTCAGEVTVGGTAGGDMVTEAAPALVLPGPIGRRITANLGEILDVLDDVGVTDPRLYGDIADGCEGVESSIVIGVTPGPDTTLFRVLSASGHLAAILAADVRVMAHEELPDHGYDGPGVPLALEAEPPIPRSA